MDRRNYRQVRQLTDQQLLEKVENGQHSFMRYMSWNFSFWYLQLVDTTVEIANKVGAAEIISRVVDDLKDEAEQYRKMVMESIEKIMGNLGSADIDSRLEEQLIDGILYAFQEQTNEVSIASKANTRDGVDASRRMEASTMRWVWPDHILLLQTVGQMNFVQIDWGLCLLSGRGDVEWFWNRGECAWQACQALPASDLRYHSLASQQQVSKGATASRWSHLQDRSGHENLPRGAWRQIVSLFAWGRVTQFCHNFEHVRALSRPLLKFSFCSSIGKTDGTSWCCVVRIPRRRVSGSFG